VHRVGDLRRLQSFPVIKTNQLKFYKEVNAVYFEVYTEHAGKFILVGGMHNFMNVKSLVCC
jgi:TolB-like protein